MRYRCGFGVTWDERSDPSVPEVPQQVNENESPEKEGEETLQGVHSKLAGLLSTLLDGVPTVDEKTGETVVIPPTAAHLNVVRQFLKDNSVTAIPKKGTSLGNLKQKAKLLPFPSATDSGTPSESTG
jgi:hypothetical protein